MFALLVNMNRISASPARRQGRFDNGETEKLRSGSRGDVVAELHKP